MLLSLEQKTVKTPGWFFLKQQGNRDKNKPVQLILPQLFYMRSKQLDGIEDKLQHLKGEGTFLNTKTSPDL